MKLGRCLRFAAAALWVGSLLLVAIGPARAQAPAYDLARDWSLEGTPFKGLPFGPDYAWSVCAVQFKPDLKWEPFDRAMHFTVSNPWLDLYGIDGWWLGSSPVARKPMAGKSVGQGNIPGMVHGVNYDWPVGTVGVFSWPESDQTKGERPVTAVVWTAPRAMQISVAGGIWMAGQYLTTAERRSLAMMWINRASAGSGDPNEIIFKDVAVPLWTEGYGSAHPEPFAQILGNQASRLERVKVEKGDRIAVGFYWDAKAAKPGLSGIDFKITELRDTK